MYEVKGAADFNTQLRKAGNKLVVVDFYATWCGPCKAIVPFLDQLAAQNNDVIFLKVCEGDDNDDVIASHRVQAFPTIAFFVGSNEKQRIKGADMNAIQSAVAALKPAGAFQGTGATLGSSGSGSLSPAQAREARLAALAGRSRPSTAEKQPKLSTPSSPAVAVASDDDLMAGVTATSPVPAAGAQGGVGGASTGQPAASSSGADTASASDAAEPPVDAQALQQLTDMGFGRNRCVRALFATGKNTGTFDLSTALEWITQHEDDADIDEALVMSKRARTGPDSGSSAAEDAEDDAATSAMSAEDKKAYIKAKLAQRRAAKEAAEKEEAKAREVARRQEGQGMVAAKEEFDTKQRRLHREQLAKEKRAATDERERIRKSMAQDRLEKLAQQYGGVGNIPADKAKPLQDAISGVNPADTMPPAERMEAAIGKIARHKVDDAGVKGLKTLRKLIGNVVSNPEEEKFQRINLANRVIKERITTLAGGIMFLSAAGFARPDGSADEMVLREDLGTERLEMALQKLDAALA